MNILLIGLGNIGKIHLRNFLKFNDLNIYIYDTKSEVVNELVGPRVHLIENPLNNLKDNKIDAAVISTPTAHHKEISIELSKNGIPHLIEKPITTISNEFEDIFNEAKNNKTFLMCGFVERFHNCIVSIEKELRDQTVLAFNSVRNSVPPDNSRVLDEVKFDVLIHDLDLFNFLNKDVILENIKVVQNNEFANAIYTDNKVVGNFSANRKSHKKTRQINIITDQYEYEINLLEHSIKRSEYEYFKNIDNIVQPFIKSDEKIILVEPSESIYNEQKFFIDNLKSGYNQELCDSYKFAHYSMFS